MSKQNESLNGNNIGAEQWENMEPEGLESTEAIEDIELDSLESDEASESGEEKGEDGVYRKIGDTVLGVESSRKAPAMTGSDLMQKFDENIRNYQSYLYDRNGNDKLFHSTFEPHLKRLNGILKATISELQAQNPEGGEVSAESILKQLRGKRLEMAQEGVTLRDEVDRCKIEGDTAGLRAAEKKRTEHIKAAADIDRVYETAYGYVHEDKKVDLYAGLAKHGSEIKALYADGRKRTNEDRARALYATENIDRILVILSEKAGGRDISELSEQEVMDAYSKYDHEITAKCQKSQKELSDYRDSLGFFGSIAGRKARKLKALERSDILQFDRHLQSMRMREALSMVYSK